MELVPPTMAAYHLCEPLPGLWQSSQTVMTDWDNEGMGGIINVYTYSLNTSDFSTFTCQCHVYSGIRLR